MRTGTGTNQIWAREEGKHVTWGTQVWHFHTQRWNLFYIGLGKNIISNQRDLVIYWPLGFYTNLYKAETDFDEPICKQYLDKLELPRISQLDKEILEAPLSLEELYVSLKSLQKGKSPGLDGLPPELYLEIWDLVGTLMLNLFNFAIEHGVFHRDQKTSLISLLLKKGKDPLDCSSYRPISLIPCDLKINAKVFASRMEKVIHSLIKEDQTGFIKGCNASDNNSTQNLLDYNLQLDGCPVTSSTVKNLGVILDSNLSFEKHISNVTKTAFFHLRNIAKLRNMLPVSDAEKLVHAFMTSRLDYCNALLGGCPASSINKLQVVQNAAARVLTRSRKYDHITPILQSLHWLPIKFRIIYKILLLAYKALNQGSSTKTAWGPVTNPPHQPRSGELYIKTINVFFLPGQGICRIFKLKFKTFFKTCTKKKKKKYCKKHDLQFRCRFSQKQSSIILIK